MEILLFSPERKSASCYNVQLLLIFYYSSVLLILCCPCNGVPLESLIGSLVRCLVLALERTKFEPSCIIDNILTAIVSSTAVPEVYLQSFHC